MRTITSRLLSRQILKQPNALSGLQIRLRDLAARRARVLRVNIPSPPLRGRAERRTLDASAASCAAKTSTRVSHHGHAELVRRSARSGFHGLLRLLPGERSLDGSPLQLWRWPSSPKRQERLDAATWRKDDAPGSRDLGRPQDTAAVTGQPPAREQTPARIERRPAATASRPAVVTIANAPLIRAGRLGI